MPDNISSPFLMNIRMKKFVEGDILHEKKRYLWDKAESFYP